MTELEKLLNENEPENLKLAETESPKQIKKPSAATFKANTLAAQEITIAAASVGSALFRSAKDFMEDIPKTKGYKDEMISAPVSRK